MTEFERLREDMQIKLCVTVWVKVDKVWMRLYFLIRFFASRFEPELKSFFPFISHGLCTVNFDSHMRKHSVRLFEKLPDQTGDRCQLTHTIEFSRTVLASRKTTKFWLKALLWWFWYESGSHWVSCLESNNVRLYWFRCIMGFYELITGKVGIMEVLFYH